MAFRDFLPFQQAPAARRAIRSKRATVALTTDDQITIAKVFKVAALALGFEGGGTGARASFEENQYDFDRILQAIDTDSYVKQGLSKYKELMWKEGWSLIGENRESVDYMYTRFDFLELVMRRPMQDLFMEIGDQLVKFANCFVVKARGDISAYFPGQLQASGNSNKTIVGYYVIPAETVEIARDRNNKIIRYRQNVVGGGGTGGTPEFKPEDVIHFAVDRKPGRAFGTPFLVASIDDVVALRQMEEDIQNLVHKELFPLYKYKVGTAENPAEPEEIDQAADELAGLRTDGGLVLPERHDVDVIGAGGNALDARGYLEHFRQRVVVGLGIAEHHLGMTSSGGNRSITDRLDIALYDRIKMYQRYLEDMIKLHIVNELLIEGGYNPFLNPSDPNTTSDRVLFKFKEIDVDTQIKKQNHVLQKWQGNAISLQEARMELGDSYAPEVPEQELFAALQARMQVSIQQQSTNADSAAPSTGTTVNLPNAAKRAIGNKDMPANQNTRRLSPNVRRSDTIDDKWLSELAELIDNSPELD